MDRQKTNELIIPANTEKLYEVLSFVHSFLLDEGCPDKVLMRIEIAVEETFVNIAHYAYQKKDGEAVIRVEATDDPKAVRITFIDSGVPYNPLEKPDPDIDIPAEKRPVGGLGIFMTKNIMDEVSYEYSNGKNVFSMKKLL